jgi:hypothetical protein
MTARDLGIDWLKQMRRLLRTSGGVMKTDGVPSYDGTRGFTWYGSAFPQTVATSARIASAGFGQSWKVGVITTVALLPSISFEDAAPALARMNRVPSLGAWVYREGPRALVHCAFDVVGDLPGAGSPVDSARTLAAAAAWGVEFARMTTFELTCPPAGHLLELDSDAEQRVARASAARLAEVARIVDEGAAMSHWVDPPDLEAARAGLEGRGVVVETVDGGLDADLPIDAGESARLSVRTAAESPVVGSGCEIRLTLPGRYATDAAYLAAAQLDIAETWQQVGGPTFGGWTVPKDDREDRVQYQSFLPNAIFAPDQLRRHVLSMQMRSKLAASLIGRGQVARGEGED